MESDLFFLLTGIMGISGHFFQSFVKKWVSAPFVQVGFEDLSDQTCSSSHTVVAL